MNINFYYFRIGRDGSYNLFLKGNSVVERTLASGSSSFIHPDQPTVIAVVAQGEKLDLYVNMHLIVSVNDNALSHGAVAIAVEDVTNPVEAVFSNAKVWTL